VTGFTILTVCSGNICRSPMAAQLLSVGLSRWPGVTVASAGTTALTGYPMPEQAAALSRKFGGDPSHHAARELTAQQLLDADLVFGMAREHRRAVAELAPRAIKYSFTIREFARLMADIAGNDLVDVAALSLSNIPGRLSTLVSLAATQRGSVAPALSPEDDDVIDPYRRSDEVYDGMAQQLVPAVETVLSLVERAATVTG